MERIRTGKFAGRAVVVTGAAGGIGRELAVAYAAEGASVALADRREDGLRQTRERIAELGGEARDYVLDLSEGASIAETIGRIAADFGKIDILVNNAGLGIGKPPGELAIEEWDYVLNVNLRGAFLCSREAAGFMKRNGGGAILNVASTRAAMSEPNTEAYAASKGGLVSLTHAMAVSLGPDGIRVNAVSPGWIETGVYESLREADHAQHPSGRVGRPEDIVKAAFYLTDPDNGFVTGANLTVDGGMTKKMIYIED